MNELQVISQQQILGNSFSIFGTTDEPLFCSYVDKSQPSRSYD